MILGIDEVGRGPWAGPLVVGAVVLGGEKVEGLADSKKLSKKRREQLDIEIREKASGIGLGWVDASEIDTIGLSAALRLATKRAVEKIKAPYHEIVIDGTVNFLEDTSKGRFVTTIKKADSLVPCVSAASIIAKVARDRFMTDQDAKYPGYKFASHVGYGTAAHREAIDRLGVTPLHRLSIEPLKKYSKHYVSQTACETQEITTKQIGDNAEDAASKYLMSKGHDIIERNWKTKFCEIDIVSVLNDVVYFTEVKYRRVSDQGGGLAAITGKKLRQMKFAAEFYALAYNINDTNLRLAAVSVSGEPPEIEQFLESQ